MTGNQESQGSKEIAVQLASDEHWLQQSERFRPFGGEALVPFILNEAPSKLTDLEEVLTRSYDLTVSAAVDLQIPIAGSGSGGLNRRVIVLERAGFNKVGPDNPEGSEKHYGYAIRLCVTVNRWQATSKISLPFLAASAQLGTIEAQWILQVIGLKGKAIDKAILPPTELSVETFFIAKQSLEKLVEAINDSSTVFKPQLIAEIRAPDNTNLDLRRSIGKAYALTCLERGRSLEDAQQRLGSPDTEVLDAIREVYEIMNGIGDTSQKPSNEVRHKADEICGRLRTDIPFFG